MSLLGKRMVTRTTHVGIYLNEKTYHGLRIYFVFTSYLLTLSIVAAGVGERGRCTTVFLAGP